MKSDLFYIPPTKDPHEGTRRRIQEHPNFKAWYLSLGEEARIAFDLLFLTDVTPELIEFTRRMPEAEWWQSIFIRVISGGNPDSTVRTHLTQDALLTVIADLETLGRRSHPPVA